MTKESAAYWMERCLSLAANADSATSPNPRVGCVILSPEGKLLGEGWHRCAGGPHAETDAIQQAGSRHGPQALKGATLVVNLEPCNHQGRTPPCTRDILQAGVARVIIGMRDPNPKAAGGIAMLRKHRVAVTADILRDECYRFNEAFVHWHTRGLPFVTLKIAQSLDGCVATVSGESQWITGGEARKQVHVWRKEHDAVLVGSRTARMDNPRLTVRHVSGTQPMRIVLDGSGRLPATLKLFTDQWAAKTTVVVAEGVKPEYSDQFLSNGGCLVTAPSDAGRVSLPKLIRLLGGTTQAGSRIQSLFVEAGPELASALLRQNLVDRVRLFIAPKMIGNGLRAFGDLGVEKLTQSLVFAQYSWEKIGVDQLFTGYKHPIPA
ncbi:MAG: bifunctional diaminohydroxyphosphoribosylaminopyrimidine deaminase/5-amino-6-(5-phosphoribosylamino)uracil reductase RibD [Bacteroidetes bacterium]|nr:bifunctional diaminohydroxyphosphoribosylaminopyrimidine deaminase/5-amino-6-(5-phosphoribosylamino)uracil reductase RibD [Bacteroidota bacterium]MDE2671308.1 bifunctional diaminohydroxyphosphoribosylaminopyrimidine deaminase/5-amino-6-(5-phosphoribosylamino)uracil reductase RibD [Bacteroidota bacterium]